MDAQFTDLHADQPRLHQPQRFRRSVRFQRPSFHNAQAITSSQGYNGQSQKWRSLLQDIEIDDDVEEMLWYFKNAAGRLDVSPRISQGIEKARKEDLPSQPKS